MKRRKSRLAVITAGMLLAGLAGTGCRSQPKPPLRIGVNFWATTEFIFLAQQKHFFDDAGIPVELVEYSSLSDLRRGFERGQVDAMAGTLVELLLARENTERRPQVVLVVDFSNGADFIVAKRDISSVADLKGRRVGAEAASLGILVLGRALEQAGLSLSDILLISKDQSNMARTYVSGDIEAAVTYPPFSVGMANPDRGDHIIFRSSQIPGEVVDTLAVDASKVDTETGIRLQRVWTRVVSYVESHVDEAYAEMAKRERITTAEFRATMDGLRVISLQQQNALLASGTLRMTTAKTALFLQQAGVLKKSWDVDDILAPAYRLLASTP